jgi:hypothetical protein
MDLARLYELHADECARSAEKIDNPGHRTMLLKAAASGERLRKSCDDCSIHLPHKSSPLARNCKLNTQPYAPRSQEGADDHSVVNPDLRTPAKI